MPAMVVAIRSRDAAGNVIARLGLLLADEYLEFLAGCPHRRAALAARIRPSSETVAASAATMARSV